MSLFMRAVLAEWHQPSLDELDAFVQRESHFRITSPEQRGWSEFEVVTDAGTTVLVADLTVGEATREELDELSEFLEDVEGPSAAREKVADHLASRICRRRDADPDVRLRRSSSGANVITEFLEQRPGVLVQVDGVGWYDGPNLILQDSA